MVRGFVWLRRLSLLVLLVLVAAACNGIEEDISEEEQEVRDAISDALPDLETYELVEIDEAEVRERLQQEIGSADDQPAYVTLPILRENGEIQDKTWTAYHVNVRDIQPVYTDNFITQDEAVAMADPMPEGPSSTFQGVPPDLTAQEIRARFEEQTDIDESVLQPSVLNLIGDRIEGAYYGGPEFSSSYVIESVQTILEPEVGVAEASRLADFIGQNYVIYRHDDFQPPVEHGETELQLLGNDLLGNDHDHGDHDHALEAESVDPQLHTQTRTLHPVMVADSSVFDPDTNTWLVSNWFDRVDAAANRQNAFLWLANIERDIPTSESSLAVDNNRVFVKTEVGGYLVLTEHGKDLIDYPSNGCGGSNSFINEVRGLSSTTHNADNEYWMWWTTNYGGGCGYISTLDRTPRNGAVAWSGYGSGTVDWTSFVFMHESGHIIGGTHQTNAPGSPETYDSHRCEFLGFWEFGPTGPSVMSYAGGTRTYCFAQSPVPFGATDDKKNLTKLAEFLHGALN